MLCCCVRWSSRNSWNSFTRLLIFMAYILRMIHNRSRMSVATSFSSSGPESQSQKNKWTAFEWCPYIDNESCKNTNTKWPWETWLQKIRKSRLPWLSRSLFPSNLGCKIIARNGYLYIYRCSQATILAISPEGWGFSDSVQRHHLSDDKFEIIIHIWLPGTPQKAWTPGRPGPYCLETVCFSVCFSV